MSIPNLGNLLLHAFAEVTGATGAIANAQNVVSCTRSGAGIYLLNLGTEIDATQRLVALTPIGAVDVAIVKNAAGDTDSVVPILTFDVAGAAGDVDFQVAIFRIASPA